MKITIQEGEFSYIYDDSVNNKIKDGFLEEGYTNVHQAIDAFLQLLCNCYDSNDIMEDINKGDFSF